MQNTNYPHCYRHAPNTLEFIRQSAFHQAGYAAAICFSHKSKNLPMVFFQIEVNSHPPQLTQDDAVVVTDANVTQTQERFDKTHFDKLSADEKSHYLVVYEANIINLLVGVLAEAKYCALRDGEVFTRKLISTESLAYYGGEAIVREACDHLSQCLPAEQDCNQKLRELLTQAFLFIDCQSNWRSICQLAGYILNSHKTCITYEQVMSILEFQCSLNNWICKIDFDISISLVCPFCRQPQAK